MAGTSKNPERKITKTYWLSRTSVEFLEKLRKKRGARSVSALVDELVLEAGRREQLKE
jgi:hypothetical protein